MFGAWSAKIESFVIFFNPLLTEIEEGVFDLMPSLIDFAAYSTGDLVGQPVVIDPTEVTNNPKLKNILYGYSGILPAAYP